MSDWATPCPFCAVVESEDCVAVEEADMTTTDERIGEWLRLHDPDIGWGLTERALKYKKKRFALLSTWTPVVQPYVDPVDGLSLPARGPRISPVSPSQAASCSRSTIGDTSWIAVDGDK